VEVVTSLSQGRTAAAQCGLFTYKSVPVIFEPPCIKFCDVISYGLVDELKGFVYVEVIFYQSKGNKQLTQITAA